MSAHGDSPKLHRIVNGEFVCSAPADAKCRTYPTCDCEAWCCCDPGEHEPGEHCCMTTEKAGQECWMLPHIAASGLADAYVGDDSLLVSEESARITWPDGPVTCTWDDGLMWEYAGLTSEPHGPVAVSSRPSTVIAEDLFGEASPEPEVSL